MKRWGKWGVFGLAGCGLLMLAVRFVISQQPASSAVAPNYAELFERARPHLEIAHGGKLELMPQFRAVTAAQLATTPDPDLDIHLRLRFPHLQGETLTRTRQVARQIVSSADVARYVEGHGIIVIAAENLAKIASWDEALRPVNSEAFLQLTLIQEVVRWDLDRRFNLAALRSRCRDVEEWEALHAVIEGRVQTVTHQVAVKLGSTAVFPLLAGRYVRVPDSAADPSLKAVTQTALHGRFYACAQGRTFYDALAAAGMADAQVFNRLPRQLTVLRRPDLWIDGVQKNRPDLFAVLRSLEGALPASDWQPAQQTWTPEMLSQVAEMLGAPKERAEKVSKSWYEGRTLVWTHRVRPDRNVALSVVRHDSEIGARGYFGFAVDLQRKHDTLPPGTCGPTIRVVESKSTALRLDGFDEAVRNEKLIAFGEMPPLPVSLVLARSGNLVVECTWHGPGADAGLVERLVREVKTGAR